MDHVLEEIEFLALSANRVEVLCTLRDRRYSRQELSELTGASQPTLGRILQDFEERNWIVRSEGSYEATGTSMYEATATGRLVADGITSFSDILETELKLRDIVEWLPTDAMTFDLRELRDATITVPSRTRPTAPIQRVTDLMEVTDHVQVVSHAFNERTLEAVRRLTVDSEGQFEGKGQFEGVFSATAIEAVADDAILRRHLRELLSADKATIRVSDEQIPLAVTITEQAVSFLLRDENGMLQAALDTESEEVLSWARELHGRYWNEATPLNVSDLE